MDIVLEGIGKVRDLDKYYNPVVTMEVDSPAMISL